MASWCKAMSRWDTSHHDEVLINALIFRIPPAVLRSLLTHHHYSQKIREGYSLDLFNALNPAVASICPYNRWLWLCHWKHSPTFPIFGIPPRQLHQLLTHQHYSHKIREGCSLDLFDALDPAVASVCPYDHWWWLRHWKHSPTLPIFGIPPNKLHQLLMHQQLLSELREMRTLDIFDMLNLAAISVCPYKGWLWLSHWKHSLTFPIFGIPNSELLWNMQLRKVLP